MKSSEHCIFSENVSREQRDEADKIVDDISNEVPPFEDMTELACAYVLLKSDLAAEKKKTSDLFAKMCGFNLRINAVGDDLTNFLTEEAIRFAGKELFSASKKNS